MAIHFHRDQSILHLQSASTSYIINIYPSKMIGQLYWGPRLEDGDFSNLVSLVNRNNTTDPAKIDYEGMEDVLFQEYPCYGTTDFRPPALQVLQNDGSSISSLRYVSHQIIGGKPALAGMPATWCANDNDADTLVIVLKDELTKLAVELSYTIFQSTGAIARSARITNAGTSPVQLRHALSMAIDLPPQDLDFIHFQGTWARERELIRQPLKGGSHLVESTRGISSHQQNPFIVLASPDCGEERGTAYGFSLVWSGNFVARADKDQFGSTRVLMGINPFDFSYKLETGESFQTPECLMVQSDAGFGDMSRRFHRLFRDKLVRGNWAKKERPILVNNWEATYFDFTADKILDIARAGKELGIDLFVLDDGWFGHRDSDNSSLGDWFEDRRKLPDGLKDLAERVTKEGLMFGLWFEPEMISPDSELYKAHPDWCLHVEGRHRTQIRNQYVLDLSRKDVRDGIVAMVSEILSTVPISYVKWDMNRPLTEMGSAKLPADRQREISYRYVMGVYDMMERITSAFPEVLFEGCSGGGARFDPGILYYMPQIWTSDDSDAVERLKIQYATSFAYPVSTIGAHVSASPNHQCGRVTPLETRGNVAMSGNFGYELDLTKFNDSEKEVVKGQVAFYKKYRRLVQNGDLYRLKSPFEGNETAWTIVSTDKTEAFVMYASVLAVPNPPLRVLKLAGLDPAALYRIEGPTTYRCRGDQLMQAGLRLPTSWGDFQSAVWVLSKE